MVLLLLLLFFALIASSSSGIARELEEGQTLISAQAFCVPPVPAAITLWIARFAILLLCLSLVFVLFIFC